LLACFILKACIKIEELQDFSLWNCQQILWVDALYIRKQKDKSVAPVTQVFFFCWLFGGHAESF